MKKIALLSNSVTGVLEKYFKDYSVTHLELGNIVPTLYTPIQVDYLIIILDYSYYFDGFISDEAFERMSFL